MMESQELVNILYGLVSILFTIVLGLVGWGLTTLYGMTVRSKDEIKALSLRLAENYVPRSELQETFRQFGAKLDDIYRTLRERG